MDISKCTVVLLSILSNNKFSKNEVQYHNLTLLSSVEGKGKGVCKNALHQDFQSVASVCLTEFTWNLQ